MATTVSLTTMAKEVIQSQPYGFPLAAQIGYFTADNLQPGAGWAISATQWGMTTVLGMIPIGTSGTGTVVFQYDAAGTSLRAYQVVTGTTGSLGLATSASANGIAQWFLTIGQ